MLCLKNSTDPGWIENALDNMNSIMIDHAHAEKKAAFTALSLINKYPGKTELNLAMSDLIEEEIDHYRSVVKILVEKGITLIRDTGDDYVKQMLTQMRKEESLKLLDQLLIAGIIEARSCERLQILADNINDKDLAEFYQSLGETEARHYMTFVKLAKTYYPEEEVKDRLDQLSCFEANLVAQLKNEPLMHG